MNDRSKGFTFPPYSSSIGQSYGITGGKNLLFIIPRRTWYSSPSQFEEYIKVRKSCCGLNFFLSLRLGVWDIGCGGHGG